MPMIARMPDELVFAGAEVTASAPPADPTGCLHVKQGLVAPPFAPLHGQVTSGGPKIIEVYLGTTEQLMTIDPDIAPDTGAEIWALTYSGSVPGPLIIAHEGDYVELTQHNPAGSVFDQNIDFHASTGHLAGAALFWPGHVQPVPVDLVRVGLPSGEVLCCPVNRSYHAGLGDMPQCGGLHIGFARSGRCAGVPCDRG